MQKHEELRQLLIGAGASFVGFSDVTAKSGSSFKPLQYAVTIGLRLSDAIVDEISDRPTYTYFHHYRTVNTMLDQIALRGTLFIQQLGYNAAAIPASQTVNNVEDPYSGAFPHKTAAVLSGMGCIGKNALFIHREYGPRVRLATILTDMPVIARDVSETSVEARELFVCASKTEELSQCSGRTEEPSRLSARAKELSQCSGRTEEPSRLSVRAEELSRCSAEAGEPSGSSADSLCTNCNLCVKACPAMALTGREWCEGMAREEIFDAKACSDYMNRKFKHIGRGSVCGICVRVCPIRYKNET